MTHHASTGRRVLQLSKEAIRVLSADQMAAAVAGATECITTSWSTESNQTQGTTQTTLCK